MAEKKRKTVKVANQKKKKSKYNAKANLLNEINILGWQQKKQRSKLGKSISNNTTEQQMNIDQEAIGIHFNEEIIMEILCRLPVWSLLRFKCVSKLWKALIADPYFKMKHLNHAKNDQYSQKLLTSQKHLGKDAMFNFYCSSLSSVQGVVDEQKLDCPSTCKPVCCLIFCCGDGMILLGITDRINQQLLLWNPSTRESIVLPDPESPLEDCVYGLAYDATSDDYKILSINLQVRSDHHKTSIEILALKSGSWRKICKYPTGIHRVYGFRDCGMDSLAFVNGAFHWLGLSQCYTIVSFNISNELYGNVALPELRCSMSYKFIDHGVSVLGGRLCFHSTYSRMLGGIFKLWVMKDYGVKESWTQLITIQDRSLFTSAKPKYMFSDGEVLLRCEHWEGGCSSVYRTSRRPFGSWNCETCKLGIAYTESLISPKLLI